MRKLTFFRITFLLSFMLFISSCKKEDVNNSQDFKALGTSARDLLAATPYDKLLIEISYMPGHAPDAESVNALVIFLNTLIYKPAGIQVIQRQIPSAGKPVLTLTEIVKIEKDNRQLMTSANSISVHILITDSDYSVADVFGTSYWNTSFTIFGKTINESSGGAGQISRQALMTTIMEHEFGHLLGLVGQGSPMQTDHKDHGNGAHCINPTCLMNANIETNPIAGIPILDANCRQDLTANGGR